jgi:hypothetical protein
MIRFLSVAVFTVAAGLLAASVAQPCGKPKNSLHSTLKSVEAHLKELFRSTCPAAKVFLEDGALLGRFQTQQFMVHGTDKTGEWTKDAHEELGPGARGFLLRVTAHKRKYSGQTTPHDFGTPYWMTHWKEYANLGEDGRPVYLLVYLSYGTHTSVELLQRIKVCVAGAEEKRHD